MRITWFGDFNWLFQKLYSLFSFSSSKSVDDPEEPEEEMEEAADHCDEYNSILYSPQYVSVDSLEPGTIIVSEEDDLSRLKFARLQVQNSGSRVEVSNWLFSKIELAVLYWCTVEWECVFKIGLLYMMAVCFRMYSQKRS